MVGGEGVVWDVDDVGEVEVEVEGGGDGGADTLWGEGSGWRPARRPA